MSANVDAHLHGSAEVERDDVLKVSVGDQRLRIRRAFRFNAPHAVPKRLQFLLDYLPVHATLFSASTLVR